MPVCLIVDFFFIQCRHYYFCTHYCCCTPCSLRMFTKHTKILVIVNISVYFGPVVCGGGGGVESERLVHIITIILNICCSLRKAVSGGCLTHILSYTHTLLCKKLQVFKENLFGKKSFFTFSTLFFFTISSCELQLSLSSKRYQLSA